MFLFCLHTHRHAPGEEWDSPPCQGQYPLLCKSHTAADTLFRPQLLYCSQKEWPCLFPVFLLLTQRRFSGCTHPFDTQSSNQPSRPAPLTPLPFFGHTVYGSRSHRPRGRRHRPMNNHGAAKQRNYPPSHIYPPQTRSQRSYGPYTNP